MNGPDAADGNLILSSLKKQRGRPVSLFSPKHPSPCLQFVFGIEGSLRRSQGPRSARLRRGGEDDRGGAERPPGEEGAGQVQRGRHHRRPQEAGGGADRDAPREDPHPEVVQHLQGPHHPQGLRDPRRHGSRALLQLAAPPCYQVDQNSEAMGAIAVAAS